MQWRLLFTAAVLFFVCHRGYAQESLAFSRNARTFETQHSTLVMKGLAHACLTILRMPDGLPCNPASTSLNEKASIGAELLLANGYSNLSRVRKLLDGDIDQETIDDMFTKGKVIQLESNVDIQFKSKYLNGVYSPFSVKGLSVVRNEANPDVDLYSVEEKGFTFQSGMEIYNNLYAGLQVRTVDRKFIRKRFKLLQIATEQGKDLLKPNTQQAVYGEPGLTYIYPASWKPRASFFLANWGYVSEQYDDLKTPVDPQFGIAISPPMTWGDLDLSLEYRSMNYEESDAEKIHFGALYQFGSMYLSAGLDSNGASGGVFYYLDQINAGVVYSTTRFINSGESNYTQTVYVQLGWQL